MDLEDFQHLQNCTMNSAVGGEEKHVISAGASSEVTPSSCLTPASVWFSPGFPATVAHEVAAANSAMGTVTSKAANTNCQNSPLNTLFGSANNIIIG